MSKNSQKLDIFFKKLPKILIFSPKKIAIGKTFFEKK